MKKLFPILLIVSFTYTSFAQQTFSTAGANASGSGGSVSYTVGQVAYTINSGATGSVAQGVQQPYEISIVTGFDEAKGITLQYSVYPNPAKDFLILNIEGEMLTTYTASLYDMNGNLLKIQKVESTETRVDISNLAIATYFLKVTQSDHTSSLLTIKTFKIIKN